MSVATVHLDNDLYRRLVARAAASGISVDEDVQRILEGHFPQPAESERERRWRALDALMVKVQGSPVELPEEAVDSTELIRQMREEEEQALMRLVRGDP